MDVNMEEEDVVGGVELSTQKFDRALEDCTW